MSGRVGMYRGRLQLQNQEVEILRGDEAETVHTGRITPVHRATEGVTHADHPRAGLRGARSSSPPIDEPMPAEMVGAEGLIDEDARAARHPLPGRRPALAPRPPSG